MMLELTDDAVDNLRLAIVKQAAKDYMAVYGSVRRTEKKIARIGISKRTETDLRDARAKLAAEKRFFYSEWFHLLMDLNPDSLLKLLEREVDKKQKYI